MTLAYPYPITRKLLIGADNSCLALWLYGKPQEDRTIWQSISHVTWEDGMSVAHILLPSSYPYSLPLELWCVSFKRCYTFSSFDFGFSYWTCFGQWNIHGCDENRDFKICLSNGFCYLVLLSPQWESFLHGSCSPGAQDEFVEQNRSPWL